MQLSKTDFIQYLNCPKSLWLMLHRPDEYPFGEFSEYAKKLTAEGYEVEKYVRQLIGTYDNADDFSFQSVFQTEDGLFARADVIKTNDDGSIDIFEVKSSTSVKDRNPHNQLKDAAFQAITSERSGVKVSKVFIVHLNKNYIRGSVLDPSQKLIFADETVRVKALYNETVSEINQALALLGQKKIDETSCTCLNLGKAKYCDSFDHFNPDVPTPSIYNLPRISTGKNFKTFVAEGRFNLDEIDPSEVSKLQKLVVESHHASGPVVDFGDIENFLGILKYPLYFLDYESYSSAVPIIEGAKPQSPIPFQFSLHVLTEEGTLTHHEYLADKAQMPLEMIEALKACIGNKGSIISWHKAFENTQNREMAALYPDHAEFLNDVIGRTADLEDVFKTGYVDIRFGGSTSIKKVLPVIVPGLSYSDMDISDSTMAMDGWKKMLSMSARKEQEELRKSLLDCCELDTLAMVKIFEFVEKVI